ALTASSSLMPAWTLASVRSLIPSFWPILVWPLPSAPWHLAQSESQLALASAAEAFRAAAKPNTVASTSIFFIVGFCVCWWLPAPLSRLSNKKIAESQQNDQPCFGKTLTIFEFTFRILRH